MGRLSIVLLVLFPALAGAQGKPNSAPDHGRVLSCALDVFPHKLKDTTNLADTKNYVFRGKVISLGKDKKVSICYDVEHMRVAGAWVGKPMTFAADKNMGPTVEGEMLFATKPGPGWAKAGEWDDPREGKEGPLPRDWAHYKGMYVHGDKVVLSYTVGDMEVLESFGGFSFDGLNTLARTFNFGPTKSTHSMLIHEADGGTSIKGAMVYYVDKKAGYIVSVKDAADRKMMKWEGKRLVLELPPMPTGGTLALLQTPITKKTVYEDIWNKVESANKFKLVDLGAFTRGGPPRWTETIETTGTLGDNKVGPYTLDRIQLPEKNPWNASIRFAGLDFFADGRAALCTWDGDVWIVSGLDESLKKVRWKRFAAGLQQPLGLKIIDGTIYVAGRDQITKLHDLNNDGEADFYENFNNDAGLTLQRHEFVMDLETDKQGNLYYCRSGHYLQSKRGDNCCVYKLSPDGKKLEKFATGFREPNGLSIGPDGVMTVADNEGNGIPQTPIYRLLPGKNYGFTPSKTGNPNQSTFKLSEKPIVWLGPKLDTSAGSQVWVPDWRAEPRKGPVDGNKDPDGNRPLTGLGSPWGPLAGKLLHTSYGNCALFHVMIDKTAEPWQGAVWKFPLTFDSGIMRARFNPKDGQLYVCGLRGWGTSAVKDGQFARVRFTGNKTPIPIAYRVVKSGLEFTFSEPLDKAATEDDDNWAGTWSGVLKKVPTPAEMQEMPITSVRLSADKKTVTIGVDKLKLVPNFALQYRIKAADGSKVTGELHGTIHRVP